MSEHRLAEHHESKARGLELALERSIFDDDPDAIDRLTAKIAGLEANCETMTRANKLWRKGGQAAVAAEFGDQLAGAAARVMAQDTAETAITMPKSPITIAKEVITMARNG